MKAMVSTLFSFWIRRLLVVCAILCWPGILAAQSSVMIMEIKAEIDPRVQRYINLALDHAETLQADYVIIEMDTYGGALTDAKEIVDRIMEEERPIWVYINADAASAGALISIACDSIYMSPGATIGAATVVDQSGAKAPDKYQSYMRSIMRSTAEENGRDPRIAEAMVDASIVIDSVSQQGKVITFTTNEALKNGYCEGKVSSIKEILEKNKITSYKIHRFQLSTTERAIAFFLNPFISGILVLIILGGIYYELQTPGVGFPLLAALTALTLYLVPYYLNGLAENWEIIALFIGVLLILVEVFIIPGFGVAGISGITILVFSLILIMVNNDVFDFEFVPNTSLISAVLAVLIGLIGAFILIFIGSPRIARSKALSYIVHRDTQQRVDGYSVNDTSSSDMMGKTGYTYTVLRPSGKITIDDQLYDAFTRGEYIGPNEKIIVISSEGTALEVKKQS